MIIVLILRGFNVREHKFQDIMSFFDIFISEKVTYFSTQNWHYNVDVFSIDFSTYSMRDTFRVFTSGASIPLHRFLYLENCATLSRLRNMFAFIENRFRVGILSFALLLISSKNLIKLNIY